MKQLAFVSSKIKAKKTKWSVAIFALLNGKWRRRKFYSLYVDPIRHSKKQTESYKNDCSSKNSGQKHGGVPVTLQHVYHVIICMVSIEKKLSGTSTI